MAHEFKLHRYVSELITNLGVNSTPEGPGAEVLTEILEKSISPLVNTQISTHKAKKKLSDQSNQPKEFILKYDELKSKNVKELDSLVYLMSRITDDNQIKTLLGKARNVKHDEMNILSSTQTTMSQHSKLGSEELEKIKAELMKVTTSAATMIPSDAIKKAANKGSIKMSTFPKWIEGRPHLSMDFLAVPDYDTDLQDLSMLTMADQEALIIEDLLFCCEGIDGAYIHANPLSGPHDVRTFTVNNKLDQSLKELTERILPICSMYSSVVRFIEEKTKYEFGLVNQALSASLRLLIKDFAILVAQLEHQSNLGNLTLQKFWFYIQPSMRTMEVLMSVLTPINKAHCMGGNVLSILHEKTSSYIGDSKSQELCLHLTREASIPYFEILENWIYKGIINDPYSEFLIEEDDTFQKENLNEDFNDAYWEQRYTIRKNNVPVFLEQLSTKILNTGKYLNVVRQSGLDVKCPTAETVLYTLEKRLYINKIEQAFQYASSLLLDLLMKKMDLMARLRSIKHYFMLDQGDFVVQFMDLTEHEMRKPADEILLPRLETLLELSLRTSTANADPYKDDLRVDLLPFDLVTQLFKILTIETKQEKDYKIDPTDLHLSGLESFSFDYIVHWPVSLVLNRKALTRYQMLSRHFFYAKHVERQLCNVWVKDKSSKILLSTSASLCSRAYALRQRMLNFVQNFEYYVMFEVVEPQWQAFEADMAKVSNIDEVLSLHTDLLNNCLKDCMLTNPRLLKTLHKLMMICVTFCNFMQRLSADIDNSNNNMPTLSSSLSSSSQGASWKVEMEKRKVINKALSEHMDEITSNDNYELTITTFDTNFSKHLIDLLDKIVDYSVSNCEHKLMNIIHRLDYNGFYKKQLDKLAVEKRLSSSNTAGGDLLTKTLHGSTSSLLAQSTSSTSNKIRHHHHHASTGDVGKLG